MNGNQLLANLLEAEGFLSRMTRMVLPDAPGQADVDAILDRLTYVPDFKHIAYTDALRKDACAHRRDER